jgi:hypothetical protein
VEINFRLWRILLLGVLIEPALGQRLSQLVNLYLGERGVVYERQRLQLREILAIIRGFLAIIQGWLDSLLQF